MISRNFSCQTCLYFLVDSTFSVLFILFVSSKDEISANACWLQSETIFSLFDTESQCIIEWWLRYGIILVHGGCSPSKGGKTQQDKKKTIRRAQCAGIL